MKKIFTKEVIIGIITLASFFILYSGLNYLKGINLFKPTNHYYVQMSNVNELQVSGSVYVDGFKVGIVSAIDYPYQESVPEHITVQISLDKKMKIQTGSYAELKSGLTSGAYLNLVLNKYVSSYCQIGDTIDGTVSVGLMDKVSADILPQIETILPRLDTILVGLQTLVAHPALSQSLDNIAISTDNLQKSSKQLRALLTNDVPVILGDLKQVSSNFVSISTNLSAIDFQATLGKVDKAIENIDQMSEQLNNKDNSLGLLLNDRSLYLHLDSTAKNASELLKDIKEYPKRYVHFSVF